jgi:hypothetical protein
VQNDRGTSFSSSPSGFPCPVQMCAIMFTWDAECGYFEVIAYQRILQEVRASRTVKYYQLLLLIVHYL